MSVEPSACTHRPPCPGCPRLFEDGLPEGARVGMRALSQRAGLPLPRLELGAARGFRHRARLAVRGRSGSPKIGIFQAGSHKIVDIPGCLVHHPLINRIAKVVKAGIRATGTRPYADLPHAGDLRSIQVVVERSSQRAQLSLVGNHDRATPLQALAQYLVRELADDLHSLWWNGNPARTNTILGPHWQRLAGASAVCEQIGGASVFYPPGAFGQSNLDLADRLVADLSRWIPDHARIAEFYAGCGALGLGLVARSQQLSFNELGRDSLRGLAMGIDRLDPQLKSRVEVHPGAAHESVQMLARADIVIADPPRKGLDPDLLRRLCEDPPARFLYVSCGFESFLRDCDALLDTRKFQLVSLSSYALFRHGEHVETVAVFDRQSSPPRGPSVRAGSGTL